MSFVNTPILFKRSGSSVLLSREIDDKITMLDNLIELIVFTPRGSFSADPDFGFEYWNHEYSNIHCRDFNNDHAGMKFMGLYNDVTRKECQESIRKSLESYEPQLKHVEVSIELNAVDDDRLYKRKKVFSKYEVAVRVVGILGDGLGMARQYEKKVKFYMEPTVKQVAI